MRGDDQASRRPPRGVWYALILAAFSVRAVAAQDAPGADPRASTEPLELSAEQVWEWSGPDAQYLYLSGGAAALQGGTEGLRAKQVVCRIVNIGEGKEPIYEVEVYAEGDVRETAQEAGPFAQDRATFHAPEVRMKAYRPGGLHRWDAPPIRLEILRRSGFLVRGPTSAQAMPPPLVRSVDTSPPPPISPGIPPRTYPRRDPMVRPALMSPQDASATGAEGAGPPSAVRGSRRPTRVGAATPDVAEMQDPGDGAMPPPSDNAPIQGGPLPPPPGGSAEAPLVDLPPIEGPPEVEVPALPEDDQQPPSLEPLPGAGEREEMAPVDEQPANAVPPSLAPVLSGTQRVTSVQGRFGRPLDMKLISRSPDGREVYLVRNGVNIVTNMPGKIGTIDLEADQAIIWRGPSPAKDKPQIGPNGETIQSKNTPMEVYLEGNVIVRQDERKWAGRGDQRTLRAPRLYYNFLTDRVIAHDAEIDVFAPGLLAPMRIKSPRIEQYHELIKQPDGTLRASEDPKIRIDQAVTTGSRFPNPGYKINQKSLDLNRIANPSTDPISGEHLYNPGDPDPPRDLIWQMDARQNVYYMGPFPAFYWPRVVANVDDQQPALRQFFFRTNNYFGQQLLTDWNAFRFINTKKPDWIDLWNFDIDYLSARTKEFPALGSEIGWFGNDFIKDLRDPYHKDPSKQSHVTYDYYGYFNIWGLKDFGTDVLGSGPAIVTNGPPGAGRAGIQMYSTPPFQENRLRVDFRHMQSFLDPNDEDNAYKNLKFQLEAAYYTDRYFLFEYYQMLWDTGMDQETLGYGYYQNENQFADIEVSANPMNWITQTEWLPKVDYYRLGDSLLNHRLLYYQHSGLDYATITTDIMVNNPNLFAYMPYDPISNTSGTFSSGRFYTSHELDLPLNFFNAVRLVPYVQGQLVGWTDQLGGGPLGYSPSGPMGRAWGGVGSRAEMTLWKRYPKVRSQILNINGLNNKISLFADARAAFSNVRLNNIAVQDTLDDNTYEFVRRYFAFTNFQGGILPFPYDPRHYILRNMISPITGTTDIQGSIDTVMLGVHQRLQTKRGPQGKQRIVDFMTLDATTTYFPDSQRDNFGVPWGLSQYNYQWYIGDRTSIVSQGWFEFWKLVGSNPLSNNLTTGYNPNGLNVITSGISLQRPPRSNIYAGYMIIDSGPIKTSALNTAISYWLSPKWYGTFSNSYDFGDAVDLGTMFTFTRIGADYLTTIGLSVDPQRMSYQFAVQITPRMSPAFRMGSNAAMNTFDTRFAPSQ